jgi:hypothetical protein
MDDLLSSGDQAGRGRKVTSPARLPLREVGEIRLNLTPARRKSPTAELLEQETA